MLGACADAEIAKSNTTPIKTPGKDRDFLGKQYRFIAHSS